MRFADAPRKTAKTEFLEFLSARERHEAARFRAGMVVGMPLAKRGRRWAIWLQRSAIRAPGVDWWRQKERKSGRSGNRHGGRLKTLNRPSPISNLTFQRKIEVILD